MAKVKANDNKAKAAKFGLMAKAKALPSLL